MYAYRGVSWRSRSHVPNFEPSYEEYVLDNFLSRSGEVGTYASLLIPCLDNEDEWTRADLSDRLINPKSASFQIDK